MRAVRAYAWLGLRHRWRSWAALTVLLALAAGAVLAMAAGARRADSAYPRFLRAVRAPDVRTFVAATPRQLHELAQLPEVAQLATARVMAPRTPASPRSSSTTRGWGARCPGSSCWSGASRADRTR